MAEVGSFVPASVLCTVSVARYILYALSSAISLVFCLPTDAAVEPKSHPALLTKKQMGEEEERLTTELQLMSSQRNELQGCLSLISEGTVDNRPYYKSNNSYEELKLDHTEIMSELNTLEIDFTKASKKFSELRKETIFYPGYRRRLAGTYYAECVSSGLHSQLLMEKTQLKKKVVILKQEKKKLLDDWALLKHHLKDMNVICNDQEEKTSDLKTQQQEEFKRLEESLQFLQKQKEMVTQEKDLAEKLQHDFEVSQMRFKNLQAELEQATAQDENQLRKELVQQEPSVAPHSQQLLNSGDVFSSSSLASFV
ncbi:disks large homolog 5-like [Microtus ochrogaster]|uniref:Disks large homolog 5-like n=1 Tax=Microtus ochrogaster TaxID=79684 RepID=A0ABM1UTM3_MICOH|nr:disks large homolog 5-like [Microtus ochrogaster]